MNWCRGCTDRSSFLPRPGTATAQAFNSRSPMYLCRRNWRSSSKMLSMYELLSSCLPLGSLYEDFLVFFMNIYLFLMCTQSYGNLFINFFQQYFYPLFYASFPFFYLFFLFCTIFVISYSSALVQLNSS